MSVGLGRGWRLRLAAAGCVVGLLSGCGESRGPTIDPTAVDGVGTDGETTSDDDPGERGSTSGSSAGGESSTESLAWVPFGPADPTSPTPSWPVYRRLAQGDCSGLAAYLAEEGGSVGSFGTALVAVCRAAVDGQQGQWEVARTFKDADTSGLANDCLAAVLKDLLDRAVAWHDRNPGRADVAFSQVAGTTACATGGGSGSDENGSVTTVPEETETPDASEAPETSETPDGEKSAGDPLDD